MEKTKLTANILFSGIGFQERGFQMSGVFDLEVLTTSEICKESILSYAAIHCGLTPEMIGNYDYPPIDDMIKELTEKNIGYIPEKNEHYDWEKHRNGKQDFLKKFWLATHLSRNMGDISKIASLPYADLWTISFPCQSISSAGRMKGFKPDSGTRSSLLWENIRLLKKAVDDGTSPKFLMFENVKNLVSVKFMDDFQMLLEILDDLGYNSSWKVINAKECMIPQNRERVFVVCWRKDIEMNYEWPSEMGCDLRLEDLLSEDVADKYYIRNDMSRKLIQDCIANGTLPSPEEICRVNNIDPSYCSAVYGYGQEAVSCQKD